MKRESGSEPEGFLRKIRSKETQKLRARPSLSAELHRAPDSLAASSTWAPGTGRSLCGT